VKLLYFNENDVNRLVKHSICDECEKNNASCLDSDEVCLPLEILVQLCSEASTGKKLEMIDNVMGYLDL